MKGLSWSFLTISGLTLVENLVIILRVSSRLFSILSHKVLLTMYCWRLVYVKSLTMFDGSILSISCEIVVRPDLRVLRSSSVRQFIGRWSESNSFKKSCYWNKYKNKFKTFHPFKNISKSFYLFLVKLKVYEFCISI